MAPLQQEDWTVAQEGPWDVKREAGKGEGGEIEDGAWLWVVIWALKRTRVAEEKHAVISQPLWPSGAS